MPNLSQLFRLSFEGIYFIFLGDRKKRKTQETEKEKKRHENEERKEKEKTE